MLAPSGLLRYGPRNLQIPTPVERLFQTKDRFLRWKTVGLSINTTHNGYLEQGVTTIAAVQDCHLNWVPLGHYFSGVKRTLGHCSRGNLHLTFRGWGWILGGTVPPPNQSKPPKSNLKPGFAIYPRVEWWSRTLLVFPGRVMVLKVVKLGQAMTHCLV